MNIFAPTKPKSAVENLADLKGESQAIIGLFEQTELDLHEVASKITEQVSVIETEIFALEQAKAEALGIKERNLNVANKINNFLNK